MVAWTRTRSQPIQAEDTAHAMLEWPGGALGSLRVSTAEADTGDRIELLGTGGHMTIRMGSLEVELFEPDLRQHLRETDVLWSSPAAQPCPVNLPPGEADHAAVYRDLHSAILHGTPLKADGAQGRLSLELANAIILSGQRDTAVQLPLDRTAYASLLAELRAG